ncbi:hypothetical protein SEPCBS119000_006632 [Sporothrix epigloea]|uniref:Uncharacterized protein n=1 Tax=Sporothrix epigloea TaxID=1892477 RepID=A0ABP0E403_9PEZI
MADHSDKSDSIPVVQSSVETNLVPAPASPTTSTPATQPVTKKSQRRSHTPRTRPKCPEPGSLFDILRTNNTLSLFVLPILWTDVHPRLLGIRFVAQKPILQPSMPSFPGVGPGVSAAGCSMTLGYPNETAEALKCDLASLLSPDDTRPFGKSRAIKNVLSTLFKPAFSLPQSVAELDLYFGDRVYRSVVRVPVLWKNAEVVDSSSFDSAATRTVSSFVHSPDSSRKIDSFQRLSSVQNSREVSNGPVVAYVNRAHLSMIRKNLYRIMPGPEDGDRYNTPVSRLQSLRSKQLAPTDRDQDAYLTGVFIAMAQAHFYGRSPPPLPSWFTGRLPCDPVTDVRGFSDLKLRILTHDDETSEFIVYTAVVTAAFLKRFLEPLKAVADVQEQAGLNIEYTRLPVWPLLGLRERLGEALGRDLVGDFQTAASLSQDEARQDKVQDEAGEKTDDDAASTDSDKTVTKRRTRSTDTGHATRGREDQEVAEPLRPQESRSRKRRRLENSPLPSIPLGSFAFESRDNADGASSDRSKGVAVGRSSVTVESVAISSPTLSPRKKRRHKTASHISSLAVC